MMKASLLGDIASLRGDLVCLRGYHKQFQFCYEWRALGMYPRMDYILCCCPGLRQEMYDSHAPSFYSYKSWRHESEAMYFNYKHACHVM